MKSLSRVVWSEGMYLGPHHFQAQNRYFEDSIEFATSALWHQSYGLISITLDEEALRNGTISLTSGMGILPDGLLFQMPECDSLPVLRTVDTNFPTTSDTVTVFLGATRYKPTGRNCATNGNSPGGEWRYVAETALVADETNGRDEKPVMIGRKQIRLLFESEVNDNFTGLPIARIRRSGSGGYVLEPNFVPPCLQISAAGRLMDSLRQLIEVLEEKSSSLARSPGGSGAKTGYSNREVANFWFLHTLNSSAAPLRHQFHTKHGHPEELYIQLSRLAGALCTFTLDAHPRTIPTYDHDRPEACFAELDRQIRERLELLIPTNCVSIPLTPAGDYFFKGTVSDQRCFGRTRWILGLRAAMGETDLITRAPKLLKVCSQQFVPELVKRALPGLSLDHLPVPPPAVNARIETSYFSINKSGPCWSHLSETRQVGVYIPGEFPSAEPELLIVLDS